MVSFNCIFGCNGRHLCIVRNLFPELMRGEKLGKFRRIGIDGKVEPCEDFN